jgi:NADP-dependent 3-hydroxy acid dehydrogenase YdfG
VQGAGERELQDKVAFVTGGASGMGRAMVMSFAAAGMKVVAADVERSALDALTAELAGANAEVMTLEVDVGDRDAMEAAAARAEQAFGRIHVLCNNAGVVVGGRIDEMDYRDWDWVTRVNYDGVINGIQAFLPRILAHGEGGHIVNTASGAGHIPVPGLSIYNTTKYAVVGLSETMHTELAPLNVGVSVLCPGVVKTAIFDSGRNRPESLRRERDTSRIAFSATGSATEDERARMEEVLATALDPAVVGDMVVDAIRNGDLYIFTHPDIEEAVVRRFDRMRAAFARWRRYRDDHGV